MKTLADYVLHLKGVMPLDMCQMLIDKYNETEEVLDRDTEGYKFSEVNINDHENFAEFRDAMWMLMGRVHMFYGEKTGAKIPETFSFEAPRIKKYNPNEGFFDWHVDSCNAESSRRALVMFWYLNDVEEGGETTFDFGGTEFKIKPEAGSVCCFPPNYLYPHKGEMPISNSKYVISSYANLP